MKVQGIKEKTYHRLVWKGAWGWQGFLFSGEGIRKFTFGEKSRRAAEERLETGIGNNAVIKEIGHLPDEIKKAKELIGLYFSGERVEFDLPLDLEGYSGFARGVWKADRGIPYGEVRTYSEVARACGAPGAARAVGRALGANPVPVIVPCHRVVKGGGGMGGFSKGIEWRKKLLELESGNKE
ncbi:MAG: methylated-DNA--[protein]-cysteine S-methyltransferase [bacterium]